MAVNWRGRRYPLRWRNICKMVNGVFGINDAAFIFAYQEAEKEDIIRCLKLLYSTIEGTMPMDRDFGLNSDFLGKPIPVAQNELALELVKKTNQYESRVSVEKVTYHESEEGQIIPVIHLVKGEDEDE